MHGFHRFHVCLLSRGTCPWWVWRKFQIRHASSNIKPVWAISDLALTLFADTNAWSGWYSKISTSWMLQSDLRVHVDLRKHAMDINSNKAGTIVQQGDAGRVMSVNCVPSVVRFGPVVLWRAELHQKRTTFWFWRERYSGPGKFARQRMASSNDRRD